jgi:hypothetical protein
MRALQSGHAGAPSQPLSAVIPRQDARRSAAGATRMGRKSTSRNGVAAAALLRTDAAREPPTRSSRDRRRAGEDKKPTASTQSRGVQARDSIGREQGGEGREQPAAAETWEALAEARRQANAGWVDEELLQQLEEGQAARGNDGGQRGLQAWESRSPSPHWKWHSTGGSSVTSDLPSESSPVSRVPSPRSGPPGTLAPGMGDAQQGGRLCSNGHHGRPLKQVGAIHIGPPRGRENGNDLQQRGANVLGSSRENAQQDTQGANGGSSGGHSAPNGDRCGSSMPPAPPGPFPVWPGYKRSPTPLPFQNPLPLPPRPGPWPRPPHPPGTVLRLPSPSAHPSAMLPEMRPSHRSGGPCGLAPRNGSEGSSGPSAGGHALGISSVTHPQARESPPRRGSSSQETTKLGDAVPVDVEKKGARSAEVQLLAGPGQHGLGAGLEAAKRLKDQLAEEVKKQLTPLYTEKVIGKGPIFALLLTLLFGLFCRLKGASLIWKSEQDCACNSC